MNRMAQTGATEDGGNREQASALGEGQLREVVEEFLGRARRESVEVRSLRREPSPFATLYPAEVVSGSLATDETFALFVKRMGDEQADHPDKARRDREIRVYERLLAGRSPAVPAYYGARRDRSSSSWELFLEYVDDWSLKYHHLDHWHTAAERLAELHAHFARRRRELDEAGFLLRIDEDYLRGWGERGASAVAQRSRALGARLRKVVGRYDSVVDLLQAQPPTLVHNDLSPKNVIADRSRSPARICFVDWELAAVGPGPMDLVHLTYGLSQEAENTLNVAYCSRSEETDLLPADEDRRASLFAACSLHKTLYRLAHTPAWGLCEEEVEGWVGEAERWLAAV